MKNQHWHKSYRERIEDKYHKDHFNRMLLITGLTTLAMCYVGASCYRKNNPIDYEHSNTNHIVQTNHINTGKEIK